MILLYISFIYIYPTFLIDSLTFESYRLLASSSGPKLQRIFWEHKCDEGVGLFCVSSSLSWTCFCNDPVKGGMILRSTPTIAWTKGTVQLLRAMTIVLAPKAVRLHWPVLLGQWSSVDSHRNLHCKDSDCFARLSPNIVALFLGLAGLQVRHLSCWTESMHVWCFTKTNMSSLSDNIFQALTHSPAKNFLVN